jgi:membrane fusion protein (multidrug efflux system)
VLAVALLVVLIFGIRYAIFAWKHASTDDATIDADAVAITSKVTERVDRILVDTNEPVRKGQLLVQLDDRDERQKLAQAIAERDAAVAQADAAEANVALVRDQQGAQERQGVGAIAQANAAITVAHEQDVSAELQVPIAQIEGMDATRQYQAAQSATQSAVENLAKANADFERASSLVATGDMPQAQLDSARAAKFAAEASAQQATVNEKQARDNVTAAELKLRSQEANARSAQAGVPSGRGQLITARGHYQESGAPSRVPAAQAAAQAARAQIQTAQAQLRFAQDQLVDTQIRSPIDGYVGEKDVETGVTVSPGQAIMQVVPASHIFVTANYKETQLGDIHVGQPVDITVDAYKGVNFRGQVEAISPASQNLFSLIPAQNATGNFVKVTQRVPVRIVFDHPDSRYALRPGMSVETNISIR